jgi:hypothetical protein
MHVFLVLEVEIYKFANINFIKNVRGLVVVVVVVVVVVNSIINCSSSSRE